MSTSIPHSQPTQQGRSQSDYFYYGILKNKYKHNLNSTLEGSEIIEKVIDHVRENSLDEDSGCIQLLLCKAAHTLDKIQKTILLQKSTLNFSSESEHISIISCKRKYPYCTLIW